MKTSRIIAAMEDDLIVEEYQRNIMGLLDQLDDLLSFIEFSKLISFLSTSCIINGNVAKIFVKEAKSYISLILTFLSFL